MTHIKAEEIIKKVMNFLRLFMNETLVKRIMSMVLLSLGISNNRVTELTGLCIRSVYILKKEMETGETDDLFKIRSGGKTQSKVEDIESAIIEEVEKNDYHTQQQIADMVEEKFGVKVSSRSIGRLLKKNEMKRLKCGSLPAKADVKKQRNFYDAVLQPLMEKAKNGEITLLFMDASHFVMGCDFLGYIYGKTRRFIKTFSGRKRYNVLAAFNFVTKKMTTVTNDTYITSIEICELLRKVALEYAGKPIYIILDNASYQKALIVQELAAQLGISLVYIPSYSPNLNLIERFWKFAKTKLRTKYYDNFELFQETINSIVDSSDKHNKNAVDQLIGDKVQLFDDIDANPVSKVSFRRNIVLNNAA